MASEKTPIIEQLFNERLQSDGSLNDPVVSQEDVLRALLRQNHLAGRDVLSPRNIPNFFKDIKRSYAGANRAWPEGVFQAGYTGVQRTGKGLSFEFIPVEAWQARAFQAPYPDYDPNGERSTIESLSLSEQTKRLRRSDEAHLTQIVVRLRVLEHFFGDGREPSFLFLQHQLNNVKLATAEVDALYTGLAKSPDEGGTDLDVIVTMEAKGKAEDVFVDQVVRQVREAASLDIPCDLIVPVAVKAEEPSVIRVIQFNTIQSAQAHAVTTLSPFRVETFEFEPPVPGIGE